MAACISHFLVSRKNFTSLSIEYDIGISRCSLRIRSGPTIASQNGAGLRTLFGSQGLPELPCLFQGKTSEFKRKMGFINLFVLDAMLWCDGGSGSKRRCLLGASDVGGPLRLLGSCGSSSVSHELFLLWPLQPKNLHAPLFVVWSSFPQTYSPNLHFLIVSKFHYYLLVQPFKKLFWN